MREMGKVADRQWATWVMVSDGQCQNCDCHLVFQNNGAVLIRNLFLVFSNLID